MPVSWSGSGGPIRPRAERRVLEALVPILVDLFEVAALSLVVLVLIALIVAGDPSALFPSLGG